MLIYETDKPKLSGLLYWAREQLARYSYKAGWEFTIMQSILPGHMPHLHISFEAPDANNPSKVVKVIGYKEIPIIMLDFRDDESFADWLVSVILEMERHEQREWLRRDGAILDDPHAWAVARLPEGVLDLSRVGEKKTLAPDT